MWGAFMLRSGRFLSALIALLMAPIINGAYAAPQVDVTPEQLFEMALTAYEKQQYEFARAFFDRACTGGQTGGCFNMGLMTDYGVGGPEDRALARTYYKKACEGGVGEGCFYLANMMYKGEGGEENRKAARVFFYEACGLGGVKSCFLFAEMLDRGEGGSEDKPLAQAYYSKACESGFEIACETLMSTEGVY